MDAVAAPLHRGGLGFVREMRRWTAHSLASHQVVLPLATAGTDFVIGAGSTLFAASIAEVRGVPFRYVVYTPGLLPSARHTPVVFPFQVRAPWANRALWRAATTMMNVMARRRVNDHRARLGLPPVPSLMPHVLSERPIVAVDGALAAMPADCPFAFEQIRCLHPFEPEPLPAEVERFLADGPPPVYLGFGSMPDPDPATTTRRVLDAVLRLGCRAIISRGWAGIGAGPLPAGVLAIEPVSHASLFPRVTAVVHHGGAGTTHTAARAGVPQIVVPHILDQFYFARRVEALGVAPPAPRRRRLDATTLAAALRRVLEEPAFAARARELAGRLAALGPIRPDVALVLDGARRSNALAA
jgi:UDP:flavonoid glycosyltransferase YjiC (YdhE family)